MALVIINNALRNQFVYGIESKRKQGRLLETETLTFDLAFKTALTIDLCEKETSKLRNAKNKSVNYLHSDKKNYKKGGKNNININKNNNFKNSDNADSDKSKIRCYRCGKFDHKANTCKLPKSITSNSCNLKGHLASVCMKKNKQLNQVAGSFLRVSDISVVDVEQRNNRGKLMKELSVDGKPINFEIDSGAAVTLMWSGLAKQYFAEYEVHRSDLQLVTFCSTKIKVLGFIKVFASGSVNLLKREVLIVFLNRYWMSIHNGI